MSSKGPSLGRQMWVGASGGHRIVRRWLAHRQIADGGGGAGDDGSAIVEFVFLGVLMLLPIVYLVMALGRIQAGALAVEQGAREAGRAFVTSPDETTAPGRARTAAGLAYADQGFAPPGPHQLDLACASSPCLSPDARITVRAAVTVSLPGVPAFFSKIVPVEVTLTATHVATVDQFSAP